MQPLKAEDLVLPAKQYWNKGVCATCGFLANITDHSERAAVKAVKYMIQLSEGSKAKPESPAGAEKEESKQESKPAEKAK